MLTSKFRWEDADNEIEAWLEKKLGSEFFSSDPDRLKVFYPFKDLFNSHGLQIVTIAGTNGKGEVALNLEYLLEQKNVDTFLWTSPHIFTVRERFSFKGAPLEGARLLELFKKYDSLTPQLTYYEFLFYCFCQQVKSELEKSSQGTPKILILEVGLGGRLDATNVFDADIAALVSVGRDHMKILGPSLNHVLREKIEIARPSKPLVSGVSQRFLRDEIEKICEKRQFQLCDLWEKTALTESMTFQEKNWQMALKLAQICLDEPVLTRRDETFRPWARPFEMTYNGCRFILVGSHNLDGLRSLAHWVMELNKGDACNSDLYYFDDVWVGLSREEGPELEQCLKYLREAPCLGEKITVTSFNHRRATPVEPLAKAMEQVTKDSDNKVNFEKSWKSLFENIQPSQNILITGSYYFIGEILKESPLSHFFKRP